MGLKFRCLPACRKGKRSALVDHQTKNREHKQLVEAMETNLKRVMLVAGVAQRLLGKVAIVTGEPKAFSQHWCIAVECPADWDPDRGLNPDATACHNCSACAQRELCQGVMANKQCFLGLKSTNESVQKDVLSSLQEQQRASD